MAVFHTHADLVERILHRAEEQLQQSSYHSLRRVSCDSTSEGTLTLKGRVPTYYLKQVAQAIVGKLEDVEEVDNQLEVEYASWR